MDSTSLTPLEVAEILKITKNTVYELVKRGEIPAYKVGRKLRIDKEDVQNYINSQKGIPPQITQQQLKENNKNKIFQNTTNTLDNESIIICGQDMILDILGRHLEETFPTLKSFRSHMGSYNSLYNLYNDKVSISSCHLWDWETNEYNTSFVKKLLPATECIIVNLTYRMQGFYVQKGNPKNITSWQDLNRNDISYVNREKGSGVRILLDGKLRELNISHNSLKGYNTEQSSHLSVASAIARGDGDFGIGIEKVAKQIDNIDFIPLQKERYDLVIKKEDLNNKAYKYILEILNSQKFKDELEGIGGYDLKDTGKIMAEI